jgi:glucan biosynthesis protein C
MPTVHMKVSHSPSLADDQPRRLYALDWLKMLAVLGVFFIHSGCMFDLLYQPGSPQRQTVALAPRGVAGAGLASGGMYFFNFLPLWGMALFFLLSGAGTCFALRHRTSRQFLSERVGRLFLPLIAGCLVIAPFQAYFEALSNARFAGSLIQFYPFFLTHLRPVWSPQWVGSVTHHLWFLADLWVFSLLTLPVCLCLRRTAGQRLISHLARWCERPGGLLVLFVPLALIQVALRAAFPGYQNWADVGCWLTCYLYGYILFSDSRFVEAIRRQGRLTLCLGMGGFLACVVLWGAGFLGSWTTAPDYSAGCLFFQVLSAWNLWCWLLAILALALTSLTAKNALLSYGSIASFPFYLLHLPVLVVVASALLPWRLPIVAAFVCISACAFLLTLALTDLLFLRLSATRKALGRVARLSRVREKTARHAIQMALLELFHRAVPLERRKPRPGWLTDVGSEDDRSWNC